MAVVTDIKQQRRRQSRYSIYVDGRYRFSLGENDLMAVGVRIGDELTPERLDELSGAADLSKALDRTYNFLSYRERSRREVYDYLRRKDYDESTIEQIIGRLERDNLVNDERFATEWIASRQQVSPRSATHLQAELRQKGIASEIIATALAQLPEESDTTVLLELITQKNLLQRYPERQKLIQYLMGKGFRYGAIQAALEQLEGT